MIIGLPPGQAPVTEPLRCRCHSFYLVYTGQSAAAAAARRRAQMLGAHFVYARREPFLICEGGQFLDVCVEESLCVR